MSDEALRELERRYQESGAAEDEAAYLQARVRSGQLDQRQLDIAADLGHPAARIVCDMEALTLDELDGMGRLLRERWGQWELVRLSLALTRRLLPEEELASAQTLAVRPLLEQVEGWLREPGKVNSWSVARDLRRVSQDELTEWAGEHVAGAIQSTVLAVARVPMRGSPPDRQGYLAPKHAGAALGLEGYLTVVREDVLPRLLRQG